MTEAAYLVDIFGTEKDRLNCPFYWKIGACRHGEKCVRAHNKPTFSQTIVVPHMYDNPVAVPQQDRFGREKKLDPTMLTNHFEEFYEDILIEMSTIGRVDELKICNNIAKHLVGNVYVKFFKLEDAQKAMTVLTGRYYGGRLLKPEFSPVTDFREARCRQYEMTTCDRGGLCNFMHLKAPDIEFEKQLWEAVGNVSPRFRRNTGRRRGGGRRGGFGGRGGGQRGRYFDNRNRDGPRDRDRDDSRGHEKRRREGEFDDRQFKRRKRW